MGLYLVTGRRSSGNLHLIVGNFLADDKSDAGWADGRGSRSQGRPRENLEAVDSTKVLDRSPWLQTVVCSMSTWPRVPPLHGAGDRDTEVVRLGRSSWSGGHLFPQHGNRFPSSPILQIQSSVLGIVTLVPAVLLCYCDQHLSPIGNCVTVVLLYISV